MTTIPQPNNDDVALEIGRGVLNLIIQGRQLTGLALELARVQTQLETKDLRINHLETILEENSLVLTDDPTPTE